MINLLICVELHLYFKIWGTRKYNNETFCLEGLVSDVSKPIVYNEYLFCSIFKSTRVVLFWTTLNKRRFTKCVNECCSTLTIHKHFTNLISFHQCVNECCSTLVKCIKAAKVWPIVGYFDKGLKHTITQNTQSADTITMSRFQIDITSSSMR